MKQNPTGREAAKYWIVAPMEVKPTKLFATAWEYDRQHGTIAIGWHCDSPTLQDISQLADFEEFQAEIEKHEIDWGPVAKEAIWDFHCEMQVGDTVIARCGEKEIIGIGIVKKTAYYDFEKGKTRISTPSPIPEKHQMYIKPRFIEVFWIITGNFSAEELKPKRGRILQEITEPQYQKILGMLKEAFKNIPDLNAHKTLKIKGEAAHKEQQPERQSRWTQPPRSSGSELNYYIGIDLGTTNSVMAWGAINPRTNQLEPKIVPINMMVARLETEKKQLLPSYIYFPEGQLPNVGEYAKKMLKVAPDRVVEPIKHLVGTQNEFDIDGDFYTPAEFLALILMRLAANAKAHFGFIPENAIITVPAYFNTKMRAETIKAAELAGFRTMDDNGHPRVILLDQPYAVLYDRINQEIREEVEASLSKSEKPKIVLIFDLGGGALEVSLHKVSYKKAQDKLQITPIARSYSQIGGDSFDELLARHLCETFYKKFSKPDLDGFQFSQFNNAFRQYAEQAKIDLSKQIAFEKKVGVWDSNKRPDAVTIPPIIGKPIRGEEPYGGKAFELYEGFSLEVYERIIAPRLASHLTLTLKDIDKSETEDLTNDNIIYPIFDVLRKVKDRMDKSKTKTLQDLKKDWGPKFPHVDVVLLNGGMAKLHTIQKRLEAFFGSTPILLSSDGAVARGAVVFHYDSEQRALKSPPRIMQETISIAITGKKKASLASAGARLPITQRFDLSLQVGATSAKLAVDRIIPNSAKVFPGKNVVTEFQFGRPLKEKDLPLSMLMDINEQGELNVEAHPKDNPDEKFAVTVNLEALWQERFTQNTFDGLRYLNTDSEITELIANFRELQQTKNLYTRGQILNRIETQGSRIVESPNVERFVKLLGEKVNSLDNWINSLDNLGKMVVMMLLGNLATACSDTDCLYEICDAAIKLASLEEIESNSQNYIDPVVKVSIETIGKTGLPIAKSFLFNLLDMERASDIRSIVIHSIGMCCVDTDALERLKSFIEHGEDTNRSAANWALGRIGSREKKEPLPIQQLTPVISNLMDQLEMDCHIDIKRNSIYALAEICDRRGYERDDIIDSETAAEIILLLVTFLTNQMRDTVLESTPSDSSPKLQETALLAIQMIRGIDLSSDEGKSLRAIRKEN